MSQHSKTAATRCLLACLIVMLPFTVLAVEENYNPNTGISGVPADYPEIMQQEQDGESAATTKRKKSGKNGNDAVKEPVPNEKMSIQQVLNILRTTRDLSGRNLSGLPLIGLNMSRANLKGADLSNANLERADFTESNLERVNFRGANLKMVSFFQSAVTAADLEGTILDNAIWVDKRVCAKGSIGRCLEKSAAAQPNQTAQPPKQEQAQQQEYSALTQQPAQTMQAIEPPVPAAQPIQPPVAPIQPIQPPQSAPAR